ncbi:MAG: right-handed parallel beta-helix repeat-containing protein [Xanthomonadales bacterium]|nr:right-handed parallel beta-helix repeat-containing protein [Xanthomonadales bacterium]
MSFRPSLALCALVLLGAGHAAQAQSCGDTLTHSITLSADLHCSSGWVAFDVAAPAITIRLNGHTLSGTSALQGIRVIGQEKVRILGPGRISGFWGGVNTYDASRLLVQGVEFADLGAGIILNRSGGSKIVGNGFFRIGSEAVSIIDPLVGSTLPAGNNVVSGNVIGKVDTGITLCGGAAGGNLVEHNTINAAYARGIHVVDHSSGNYISGNRLHNAGAGIVVEASNGNTVIDNQVAQGSAGIAIGATLQGRCQPDPLQTHDSVGHKVYDNRLSDVVTGIHVGNDPYLGKAIGSVFAGTVVENATYGVLLNVNSVSNHVFGSTWIGVATPILDLGYDNHW